MWGEYTKCAHNRLKYLRHNFPNRTADILLLDMLCKTTHNSMTTLMHQQTAIAYEKAARSTPEHPRRQRLNSHVLHRLVRPSWRSAAESLIKELPRTLTSRELLPDQLDCPWASKGSWEVYPEGAAPQQANTANLSLQLIRKPRPPSQSTPTDLQQAEPLPAALPW